MQYSRCPLDSSREQPGGSGESCSWLLQQENRRCELQCKTYLCSSRETESNMGNGNGLRWSHSQQWWPPSSPPCLFSFLPLCVGSATPERKCRTRSGACRKVFFVLETRLFDSQRKFWLTAEDLSTIFLPKLLSLFYYICDFQDGCKQEGDNSQWVLK